MISKTERAAIIDQMDREVIRKGKRRPSRRPNTEVSLVIRDRNARNNKGVVKKKEGKEEPIEP